MSAVGLASFGAALSLVVSGICLGVFFSTGKGVWGRANDATTALAALLLVLPVAEVRSQLSGGSSVILGVATALAIGGLLVIAATSGLTAAGLLEWALSARIGGVGFCGFLLWLVAVGIRILVDGGLPAALAWLGFAAGAATAVAAVVAVSFSRAHGQLFGEVQPPASLTAAAVVAFVAVVTWCVVLGFALS